MIADLSRGGSWPLFALLAFFLVNLALVATTGPRLGGDTSLYVDGARAFLAGEPLAGRQPSYLGYITVVSIAQWTGLGLMGLVVLQVLMATLAAAVVYMIGAELGGPLAGLLAATLLTLDVETSRWHAYVLSDSLYASVFTIAVWLVHRASAKVQGPTPYAVAILVLAAAASIRPEGWFVIPAAAAYWIFRGVSRPSRRWASLGGLAACCLLVVLGVAPRLSGNVQAVGPGEMLRNGQTIWDYNGWRLPMPEEPVMATGWGSAGSAVSYAARHPLATATLMAARVGVHLAHVRPFYSLWHNALIGMWLLPIYASGAVACWRLRQHVLALWCLAAIGTQAVVVALTHADWDGRYLAHVLPLWYPLAACGIVLVAGQWRGLAAGEVARG